jgi:5-methylcytosine-specific restriction endonuclease McrA
MPRKNPKEWRRLIRAKAIALLGSVCAKCGDTMALEIDHIDPTTKSIESGNLSKYCEEKFLAELSKCQLLCKPCHIEKSILERGRELARHGSTTMYRRGCRCGQCGAAHTVAEKTRRRKLRSRVDRL